MRFSPCPLPVIGPELRDQVRSALCRKHSSLRTAEAYIGWVRRLIRFHNMRLPCEVRSREIGAFLIWRAVEEEVAASTQNQALSALIFLERGVLQIEPDADRATPPGLPRSAAPQRAPCLRRCPELISAQVWVGETPGALPTRSKRRCVVHHTNPDVLRRLAVRCRSVDHRQYRRTTGNCVFRQALMELARRRTSRRPTSIGNCVFRQALICSGGNVSPAQLRQALDLAKG